MLSAAPRGRVEKQAFKKTIPATSTLTLFTESNQCYTEATGWKVKKNTSSLGFEPRTFGLEVQHAIRCTTRTCWKTGVQQNHSSYVNINFVYRKQSMLYSSHWLKTWKKHILAGIRTQDLWIRSPTCYPLPHEDLLQNRRSAKPFQLRQH